MKDTCCRSPRIFNPPFTCNENFTTHIRMRYTDSEVNQVRRFLLPNINQFRFQHHCLQYCRCKQCHQYSVFILNTEWVTTTVLKLISLPSYQIDGWIISCRSNTRSSECIMTRTISTKSPFSSCGCDTSEC